MSQGSTNTSRAILWLLAGCLCLVVGLLLKTEGVATFLLGENTSQRWEDVVNGALLLKLIVLIDGVMLCVIWWFSRSASHQQVRLDAPVWQRNVIDDSMPMSPVLLIGAVLIASAILRAWHLNTDLWIDEVLTLVQYIQPSMGHIISDFTDDNQHLLFSALAKLSTMFFGESPWAIRLPAMLFGVASVWATFRLGRLTYGNAVGVYAALLLCVSYHHVWFSQNARGYTLLLFGTLVATELLLRAMRSGQWKHWCGYAAMLVFCVAAHLSGVFVAVAHALVVLAVLICKGKITSHWFKPSTAFLLSAWGTLHCYALMIPQMVKFFMPTESSGTKVVTEWKNPLWLINEVLAQLGIDSTLGWSGIAILVVILALVGIWYWRRDYMAVCLMVVPGVVMAGSMILLGRNLWPRLFFNMAGFVVILAAVLLIAVGKSGSGLFRGRLGRLAWIPAILLAGVFIVKLPDNYKFPKQNYTQARDFVLESKQADDSVIGLHMAGKVYRLHYAKDWPTVNSVEEISAYLRDYHTTWMLYTLPRYLKKSRPEINAKIEEQFEVVKIFRGTLGDGDIYVVRSKQKET